MSDSNGKRRRGRPPGGALKHVSPDNSTEQNFGLAVVGELMLSARQKRLFNAIAIANRFRKTSLSDILELTPEDAGSVADESLIDDLAKARKAFEAHSAGDVKCLDSARVIRLAEQLVLEDFLRQNETGTDKLSGDVFLTRALAENRKAILGMGQKAQLKAFDDEVGQMQAGESWRNYIAFERMRKHFDTPGRKEIPCTQGEFIAALEKAYKWKLGTDRLYQLVKPLGFVFRAAKRGRPEKRR